MGQALSSCAPCCSSTEVESYEMATIPNDTNPQWKEKIKTNCDKIVLSARKSEATKAFAEAEKAIAKAEKAIAEAETKDIQNLEERQNLETSVCYDRKQGRFQYYWF